MKLNKFTIKNSDRYIQCPIIDPITEGLHRPIWSVMIPTYNRVRYLEQALNSVLDQAPGSDIMQIEVIDNCSTEADIEAVVRRVCQHRVAFYKQPKNVGIIDNMITCIKRARGHLIHILHDDDLVLPGFYSHLQEAFEKESTIGAAFCRYAEVDEENRQRYLPMLERSTPGILSNWLERIAVRQLIQAPAIVVRRSVYEKLGGFHPELHYTADWEMYKRIAAHYPIWYEPQMFAYYRIHNSSQSYYLIKSGENLVDSHRGIEFSKSYLSKQNANELTRKAKENCAIWSLTIAHLALVKGDKVTAINQIIGALKISFSLKVVKTLLIQLIKFEMSVFKKVFGNTVLD